MLWIINFPLSHAAAAEMSLQSCPTLCDPTDGSPSGSPIPGVILARALEWAAIPFSNAWKWKVKGTSLSHVQLLATPWTAAHQAPPSTGFSIKSTGVGTIAVSTVSCSAPVCISSPFCWCTWTFGRLAYQLTHRVKSQTLHTSWCRYERWQMWK